MISKTKLKERARRKTNTELVETINAAKKNAKWRRIAQKLSGATREYSSVNLDEISNKTKAGDTIAVVGKVLGTGNIDKKLRVCALGFSSSAKIKLKEAKCDAVSLIEEINKNPKAEGVKIYGK